MIDNLDEVENKLLGTYATVPDLFDDCSNMVFSAIFTSGIKKHIYKIISENHAKKTTTDFAVLYNELIKAGVDKKQSVDIAKKIEFDIQTSNNPKAKVQILFDNYVRNVMKPLLHQAYLDFDSGVGEVKDGLDVIKNKITDIEAVINNVNKTTSITDVFKSSLVKLKDLKAGKANAGYSAGIADLLISQGVTVIGAVPGAGKSSLIVSIIKNNAIDADVPIIFFSIEMTAEQIMTNLWANMFELNSFALRLGDIEDDKIKMIEDSQSRFRNNLIIDDSPNVTWQYIESQFKLMRKNVPMDKMIIGIIDYLQIMSCSSDEAKENSETKMSIRCGKLANIAKQYNVALIELSQLSREVGKRTPPRPMISDLKESGAIEANAQQIWLMYRPDYYEKDATDENGNSLKGICEINRAKNRYGPTGYVYVRFRAQYSQFLDREPESEF